MEEVGNSGQKPTNPPKRRKQSAAKALRDQAVLASSLTGMTNQAIANEVGLSRQQVSKILNSDQVKLEIQSLQSRLAAGIEDALQTVLAAVKFEYEPARDLLKNFGAYQTKIELSAEPTLADLLASTWKPEEKDKDVR
jgi:predicted transcriptional regulator